MSPLTWAIILLIVGCGIVVMEVFLPSGGLLSLLAIGVVIASVVMAFREGFATGFGFTLVSLVAVPAAVALAFKYWPLTPMGKAFLGELPSDDEARPGDPRRQLVGRVGIARSKMLPSGAVMIDGRLIDAVSHGTAIDKGQAVVVEEVQGNRVIVRLADESEAQTANINDADVLSRPIDELGLEAIDDPLA